jgi:phage recombination protein Bet
MTAAIERAQPLALVQHQDYTREQLDLIKATMAPETSDLEFQLFMEVARSQGLSPLQRQIHAVMRWDARARKSKMVIQTGIDGYRLIAARTGTHLGTTDATFGPLTPGGAPSWAQVTVRKLVHGHIAEYPATAFWEEYVQLTKDGHPNSMWSSRPKGQLSKCAEALALRKAFPAELSGVYTDTEMEQADNLTPVPATPATVPQDVTAEVAQAAGVQPQTATATSPALASWEAKLGQIGIRLTELGGRDRAKEIMRRHEWRTSVPAAATAYEELKALGLELTQQAQQEPVDVPSIPLITDGQRRALMGHYGRLGLTGSEERRQFAGWFLGVPAPASTTALTQAQAATMLDTFSGWDQAVCEQTVAEFRGSLGRQGAA